MGEVAGEPMRTGIQLCNPYWVSSDKGKRYIIFINEPTESTNSMRDCPNSVSLRPFQDPLKPQSDKGFPWDLQKVPGPDTVLFFLGRTQPYVVQPLKTQS